MRELSLFSGAGGGLLGTKLLSWTHVGYVEFDDYCQQDIAQRIKDGYLDKAPIFGDIRTFTGEGYAASYTGMVDVITAGFPCQPFSAAGKRKGADDNRNMWPATIECIRVVRPRYCLLENVPGLLSSGYFGTILGDLAQSGYDGRWRILSAAEMGAPHQRKRLWIIAYDQAYSQRSNTHSIGSHRKEVNKYRRPIQGRIELRDKQKRESGQVGKDVADSNQDRRRHRGALVKGRHSALDEEQHATQGEQAGDRWERESSAVGEDVPNSNSRRRSQCDEKEWGVSELDQNGKNVSNTTSKTSLRGKRVIPDAKGQRRNGRNNSSGVFSDDGWWQAEPDVGRVVDGVAARVDRLRAIGNGQVPAVVAAVWRLLTADMPLFNDA